jgi:hypothetical protein
MKTFRLLVVAVVGVMAVSVCSQAGQTPVIGTIRPVSSERITILVGDKARIDLGTRDGLIKGDIGAVSNDKNANNERILGECAVTRTEFGTSVCELTKGRKEIEQGDYVSFSAVSYNDPNIYSVVMTTLADIVEPYEPYKDLRVCVYGVFDKGNAITGLSQQIKAEFDLILPQKKRIQVVDREVFRNLVLYPGLSMELLDYVRTQMKRVGVDVMVLAGYSIDGERVKVRVQKVDRNSFDKTTTYTFPLKPTHAEANSRIVLTAGEVTRARNIPCNIALKSLPKVLPREDRLALVKFESGGNALVEQALRRIEFNIVNPVDVKAIVDGEAVDLFDNRSHSVMLSTGDHSLAVSFRRGYFYNDTLLYTSEATITKDAVLSLTKDGILSVDVSVNAAQQKEPVSLSVYHPAERQRKVLKPITTKVEAERTVETFKD